MIFWLTLTLACICVEALFTMIEMAAVSLNKMRVQYLLTQGSRRARWLNYLFDRPTRLFGTTLIGVNVALQVGSEASRELYGSLHLSPEWTALTQSALIIIFAELAPMFAARRYSEHVTMLGIPLLYGIARLLSPLTWLLGMLLTATNHLFGAKKTTTFFSFSREELQKVLESGDTYHDLAPDKAELNLIISNIFSLRQKTARDAMIPLASVEMLHTNSAVEATRALLPRAINGIIPLYQNHRAHITGLISVRDCLRLPDNKRLRDVMRSPWFVTQATSLSRILKQFRTNKQTLAVVLDERAQAVGILRLQDVVDEIFGELSPAQKAQLVIERSFPANMTLKAFNQKYGTHLAHEQAHTLGKLMEATLGHLPTQGESIQIELLELTVQKVSLRGPKTISVRSLQ